MIENTANKLLSSTNYSNKNQATDSLTDQESGRIIQKEKLQFTDDQVSLTYSSESVTTYNKSLSLEKTAGDGFDLLRGLILNIFKEQGLDYKIATDTSEVDISTLTPEKAQELIADDGYFGVEKTSERIFQFAVGLAGGDPARIDAIRDGVQSGFKEALDAFDGKLPDISYDTYDTVMKKLDDWANGNNNPESLT